MARPRAFDEEEVLQKAMMVFWQKGYEATSLPDLLEATGLARGSLYKAFKSKRGLFLRVLEDYLLQARTTLRLALDSARSPEAGLRSWFDGALSMDEDAQPRCGCFAVNVTVELAPHDDEVRLLLQMHDQLVTQMFAQTIEQGQRAGQFASHLDAQLCAQSLMVTLHGLKARERAGLEGESSKAVLLRLIDTFVA